MSRATSFTLNGRPVSTTADPRRRLLWVLREDLGLTGAKYGCGEGYCGACTVLLNDRAVQACTTPLSRAEGATVVTIEGLERDGELHPLQQAFIEHDALQCGFCTPGMILGAYALLRRNPEPTPEQVVSGLQGHLCRCGAHVRIVEAVRTAGRTMREATP
jgi:aerobic-type carbon monoxide dehydrogenase small subunit (CoxS/CutS family)